MPRLGFRNLDVPIDKHGRISNHDNRPMFFEFTAKSKYRRFVMILIDRIFLRAILCMLGCQTAKRS